MNYILFILSILPVFVLNQFTLPGGRSKEIATNTGLLFREDFEGKEKFSSAHALEIGPWDYALQYVTDPVFSGKRSARFEIREDQPLVQNGKRSEVTIIKGLPGKDIWYSFAVYFPSDGFAKDSEREVISQWYQKGTPATSLRVKDDRIFLETGNEKDTRIPLAIGPVVKNAWQEFVLHFIHSHNRDGRIELWHNGTKVIDHAGGNMYQDVLPKWKIGLYKASFKHGTSQVNKRVIFFDNIKVGDQHASFTEMTPRN